MAISSPRPGRSSTKRLWSRTKSSWYSRSTASCAVTCARRNPPGASSTRLVDKPGEAQAVLGFTEELRDKIILSFSSAGRVSEYKLRYRVGFRVTDAKGAQVYLPTSEILLTRDMAYSDAQVLAKEA